MQSIPVDIEGLHFNFHILSGKVLATDQRSDTVVTGGGLSYISQGAGYVDTRVDSQTFVSRDIWLMDDGGKERHLRLEHDIPIRVGQTVHQVLLEGSYLDFSGKTVTIIPFSLINGNTGDWNFLCDSDDFLNVGVMKHRGLGCFLHSVFLFLCIYGIGLVIYWVLHKANKKDTRIMQELLQKHDEIIKRLR